MRYLLSSSLLCCSIKTDSADVMHPEHARQSAKVIAAFSSFLLEPSDASSEYEPSDPILILAPENGNFTNVISRIFLKTASLLWTFARCNFFLHFHGFNTLLRWSDKIVQICQLQNTTESHFDDYTFQCLLKPLDTFSLRSFSLFCKTVALNRNILHLNLKIIMWQSSLQLFLQFLTFFHVCFDFTVLFERKFDSIGNLLNQINKFLC